MSKAIFVSDLTFDSIEEIADCKGRDVSIEVQRVLDCFVSLHEPACDRTCQDVVGNLLDDIHELEVSAFLVDLVSRSMLDELSREEVLKDAYSRCVGHMFSHIHDVSVLAEAAAERVCSDSGLTVQHSCDVA